MGQAVAQHCSVAASLLSSLSLRGPEGTPQTTRADTN